MESQGVEGVQKKFLASSLLLRKKSLLTRVSPPTGILGLRFDYIGLRLELISSPQTAPCFVKQAGLFFIFHRIYTPRHQLFTILIIRNVDKSS